jgi:hypothetical protein
MIREAELFVQAEDILTPARAAYIRRVPSGTNGSGGCCPARRARTDL